MEARIRALYLRVKPFEARAFDLQAGLIPPVFGLYPRRAYGDDSPLIGFPLTYQYLTTMRADAVPQGADDLLAVARPRVVRALPERGLPSRARPAPRELDALGHGGRGACGPRAR